MRAGRAINSPSVMVADRQRANGGVGRGKDGFGSSKIVGRSCTQPVKTFKTPRQTASKNTLELEEKGWQIFL